MKKPYVIAEAGVNYYDTAKQHGHTPLEEAKYYAQRAKESGIDAIKFQTYKANTIVSKQSPAYWDTTKEPTKTQYELFLKFDAFGEKEYGEISSYCKSIGIDFISTPFDDHSADYLADMMDIYKISSSDLTNHPFFAPHCQERQAGHALRGSVLPFRGGGVCAGIAGCWMPGSDTDALRPILSLQK